LIFSGYPGAASFTENESTWKRYITDSFIETVLARDVLQMSKIAKPILLRHLFALAATLPVQFVSYTKMLGQLHLSYARYALEGLPNKVLFFS
jgi:predicted AAA+ superfamily ATPase